MGAVGIAVLVGVLVMHTMLWPDELRDGSFAAPPSDVTVSDAEVTMAQSFIDALAGDFNPDDFNFPFGPRVAIVEVVDEHDRLRMVAWRTNRAVYWLQNTLLQTISEAQMLVHADRSRAYGVSIPSCSSTSRSTSWAPTTRRSTRKPFATC